MLYVYSLLSFLTSSAQKSNCETYDQVTNWISLKLTAKFSKVKAGLVSSTNSALQNFIPWQQKYTKIFKNINKRGARTVLEHISGGRKATLRLQSQIQHSFPTCTCILKPLNVVLHFYVSQERKSFHTQLPLCLTAQSLSFLIDLKCYKISRRSLFVDTDSLLSWSMPNPYSIAFSFFK